MNILASIHRLAENNSGDVKVLKGEAEKRVRLGDFRVRFSEESDQIRIHAVKNRKDAYR